MLGYAGLPLGGAGGVDAGAERVDGDGDGHVGDIELVDGLHAEVGEGEDAGEVDGLGDEVGRATDGDEVDGLELADGGDGLGPALSASCSALGSPRRFLLSFSVRGLAGWNSPASSARITTVGFRVLATASPG